MQTSFPTIRVIRSIAFPLPTMKHTIPISLIALAFAGCAHHVGFHSSHLGFDTTPHYAQPSAIPCHGKGPIHYTTYYGSDAKWHYFESHHDLKIARYKVSRWSLAKAPFLIALRRRPHEGRYIFTADKTLEAARLASDKAPIADLVMSFADARRRQRQALNADTVDVLEKVPLECALLQQIHGQQCRYAEYREGEK